MRYWFTIFYSKKIKGTTMKRIMFIALGAIMLMTPSCTTIKDDDGRNPQLNNESFTNYVPWWATNSLQGAENVESNKTDKIQEE